MTLSSKVEKKALKALDLPAFQSISLKDIKSNIETMLNHIGREGVFSEYTKHDITHVNSMLSLVDIIVPSSTFDRLTSAECLMITLSIYFHDIGMLVTSEEYNSRNTNHEYLEFKGRFENDNIDIVNTISSDKKDDYIFQEFIRANHAKRVKNWIYESNKLGEHGNVSSQIIAEMLRNIPQAFKRDLALICESHNLDDIKDVSKYKPDAQYSQVDCSKVNVQYCAIVLRTCDLLNITNDRAPTLEMRLISPKNAISKREWLKHNSINVIRAKSKVNIHGNIDNSIQPDTFEVSALFESDDGFFSLMSYLEYTKSQLKQSHNICKKTNTVYSVDFEFPWVDIDDSSIETNGFSREQLLFTLDQTKILDLLIGHTLYNDSSVVVRELIQNSLDACSLKSFVNKKNNSHAYKANIKIEAESDFKNISITDNGIGMTLDVIKNYLLTVGSSRYQDKEFIKNHQGFTAISRFGIGLLTCFMIADDLDIITKTEESDNGILIKIRKVHGKYLLKELSFHELPNEIKKSGTKIIIYPRSSAVDTCKKIKENLKRWILVPKHKIIFNHNGDEEVIGYKNTDDYLRSHLESIGKDGEKYKVETQNIDGVDVSYGLIYNKIFKEWEFMIVDTRDLQNISGTCIEGIRVAYETPGFNTQTILAIANCYGYNSPKTNVARDRIEATEQKDQMLKKVYDSYRNHISSEINSLCKNNFSISWASREAGLLLQGLLNNRRYVNRNDKQLVENDELFNNSLYELDLVLKETLEERELTSIDKLINSNEFWTIDSSTYRSADSLIRDTENLKDNRSALSIMNSIYGNAKSAQTDHINQLVCFPSYDISSDYVFNQLLENFGVSEIKIIASQRRVDLKWNKESKNSWKKILLMDNRPEGNLFIQNSGEEVVCSDEPSIGVIKSKNIIFILKGSELHDL
ncbi:MULTISPECIES: HD domain-containing protein [Aliivibrio]|uniref:ATP-binding protein n=1 Tax=Aliivibrio finisterrensis TaxID=511998 RepID=A0A4Q5L036_9GAMM|nr:MULTISPECIES: ATP-binding protein [Aliivibrio]MDD9177239.1 ATP-binding protein [Aliivibrio sp. A6]RYU51860.1 ATP-binding protein [Aliivibrio finisterrensis]RYU54730.1 ATP-binding protein [Aliivibrio finisterrensis]RYU57662.1 ATP-binding protein [Aliivibrio finisterrensis]RYU66887.1 ATP-binding protein [Aliivibrio finisterrensis]